MPRTAVFQVLYTPNLTQKRKKWYDGKCKFNLVRHKARLSDDEGRLLAEQFWPMHNGPDELPDPGSTIQFERFIVELDSLIRTESEPDPAPVSTPAKPRPLRPSHFHSNGPSLDEVLRSESVRVRKPLDVFTHAVSDVQPKKRKYAPWGDSSEPEPKSLQELKLEMPGDHTIKHDVPENACQNATDDHLENSDEESLFVGSLPSSPFFLDDSEATNIAIPESYTIESDLESENELEIVDVTHVETPRKSIFEDIPDSLPSEGPWTKEAYVLFSWHPPIDKAAIAIKSEIP